MLVNYKEDLLSGLSKVRTAADLLSVAESQQLRPNLDEIEAQLAEYRPALMVYGVYNAGKSTLLNALLGEPIAAVADAPCTTDVQELRLGDYRVFDTPGLDAPVAHEEVTEQHLQKCDVVLFVVSTHGLTDERKTVEALTGVVRSGRTTLLVLHDKAGHGRGSEVVQKMANVLIQNVEQLLEAPVANRIEVFVANAETALRAQEKNSEALLHRSGIPELRQAIVRILKGTSQLQLLAAPTDRLLKHCGDLKNALSARLDEDPESRALLQKQNQLADAKRALVSGALADQHGLHARFRERLTSSLAADGDTNGVLDDWAKRLEKKWERRFVEADNELERIAGNGAGPGVAGPGGGKARLIEVEYEDRMSPKPPSATPEATPQSVANVRDGVLQSVGKAGRTETGQNVIKEGLKLGRKLKIPGLKGRWERTLGKWAGRTGKVLGPAITVMTTLKDLNDARREEKAEQEARRKRAAWNWQRATDLVEDHEASATTALNEASSDIFNSSIARLVERAQQADADNRAAHRILADLRELDDKLRAIQHMIRVD